MNAFDPEYAPAVIAFDINYFNELEPDFGYLSIRFLMHKILSFWRSVHPMKTVCLHGCGFRSFFGAISRIVR